MKNEEILEAATYISDLQGGRDDAVEVAVAQERERLETLRKYIDEQQERLRAESDKLDALEADKLALEKRVMDLQRRNEQYERGYSIENAVKEQERLRKEVFIRDEYVMELIVTLYARPS